MDMLINSRVLAWESSFIERMRSNKFRKYCEGSRQIPHFATVDGPKLTRSPFVQGWERAGNRSGRPLDECDSREQLPMNKSLLLIRADASNAIGAGHVMRCLALAQAWQDAGGQAIFVFAELPALLEKRLESEGFGVVRTMVKAGSPDDADSIIEIAREQSVAWVIVDGDRFDSVFLDRVRSAGLHLLLVDDFARRESFPADLSVNPNMGAEEKLYREKGSLARLCLGESYVLLRREFRSRPPSRVCPDRGCRVLVTLGGSALE